MFDILINKRLLTLLKPLKNVNKTQKMNKIFVTIIILLHLNV